MGNNGNLGNDPLENLFNKEHNFSTILKKQEQSAKRGTNGPIENLIKRTDLAQEGISGDLAHLQLDRIENRLMELEEKNKEEIRDMFNKLVTVPDKIDRLEGLVQALLIKEEQKLLSPQAHEKQPPEKADKYQSLNKHWSSVVLGSVLGTAILIAAISFLGPQDKKEIAINTPAKAITKTVVPTHQKMITLKFVNLRSHPSTKSKIIKTLYPNQMLTILKKQKQWSLVQWQDMIKNRQLKGWVYNPTIGPSKVK